VGWAGYLNSNTVKDLVRLGILSAEFKRRFVDGKSNETLAHTLYEVLLARAADPGGLVYWGTQVGLFGWENVVDRLMASAEYNNNFGDDAVPGGDGAGCG
jgi:predicted methyltransferase MtxX (methanogen marker protein 4)